MTEHRNSEANMADDFCPTHGYEHMKFQFNNPVPYCAACDERRESEGLSAQDPTAEQIDAALNAWFKSPPSETDQGLERSMKAALIAAAKAAAVGCPVCGRKVLEQNQPATGWIAPCGRRLVVLSECGNSAACPEVREPRTAAGSLD